MSKYILIATVAFVTAMPVTESFALSRCEADFKRGLREMRHHFKRLSRRCGKEVNIGERNKSRIQQVCAGNEIDHALSMKSIKNSQLTPLCHRSDCKRQLRRRGVCVKGKPFTWYMRKFGMR